MKGKGSKCLRRPFRERLSATLYTERDRSIRLVASAHWLTFRAEQQAKIDKMQADLRKLKKRSGNASDSDSDDDRKKRRGPSALEEELSRYAKNRGRAAARQHQATRKGRRDEEDDILAQMAMFTKKVAKEADEEDARRRQEALEAEEEGAEVDNDDGWMNHDLKFEVDEKELTRRAEEDYAVSAHTEQSGVDMTGFCGGCDMLLH